MPGSLRQNIINSTEDGLIVLTCGKSLGSHPLLTAITNLQRFLATRAPALNCLGTLIPGYQDPVTQQLLESYVSKSEALQKLLITHIEWNILKEGSVSLDQKTCIMAYYLDAI